jgi:hypothetical protein
MISDEKLSKALRYLANTDRRSAVLKANVERKEWIFKRAKALAFKLSEGTVADRNADAETCDEVQKAAKQWFRSIAVSEKVRAKRQTAALIVEVWRSVNANRRTGNI